MGLEYKLDTPVGVGDLNHSTTVASLKLVSISINYEDAYSRHNEAVLSVCLVEPNNGYPVNVVYQDAAALALARNIESLIGAQILDKLKADCKLPAGTVSTTADPETPSPLDPPASPEAPEQSPAS